MTATPQAPRPLAGIRVLEMGQLIAGPFAGCVLAYFGAEPAASLAASGH